MKKTIRMNERELHRIISESVKRLLRESNNQIPQYYWSISECNEEFESLNCVEDSSNSDDVTQESFSTPDEAYQDGLRNFKYYTDGMHMLEVYHFTTSGAGEYESGYMAISRNGKINIKPRT